mmetsp:Transcript_12985/g.24811  ORF Transcript_12985/g.24811 Transcript_12985/m.24811 type:complete len:89 (+) Transcript_12985:483-749(+)
MMWLVGVERVNFIDFMMEVQYYPVSANLCTKCLTPLDKCFLDHPHGSTLSREHKGSCIFHSKVVVPEEVKHQTQLHELRNQCEISWEP